MTDFQAAQLKPGDEVRVYIDGPEDAEVQGAVGTVTLVTGCSLGIVAYVRLTDQAEAVIAFASEMVLFRRGQ